MGASNVDFERKGKLSKNEIEKTFRGIQREQRVVNGHRNGYSGDFQTIPEVRYDVLDNGSGDYDKDYNLALNKSEKWEYAQAIYTKNSKGEDITLVVGWAAE